MTRHQPQRCRHQKQAPSLSYGRFPPPISPFFPAAHSVVTAGSGGRGSENSKETGRPEEVDRPFGILGRRLLATAHDSCSRDISQLRFSA